MQKGNFIQRLLQFAENKGFYMILGLCAVAIGVSTYVLFFTAPQDEPLQGELLPQPVIQPEASVSNPVPDVTVPESDETETKQTQSQKEPEIPAPPVEPIKIEESTTHTTAEEPSNSIQVSAQTTVKETVFTLPVQATEVQREYSGDTLVFDPTMSDWRTHGGTDFSCDEGDSVMAVLDGAVAEIYTDAMMGQCIRIDHGAQLESLYCGVVPQDHLKVGTVVSAGETIGRAAHNVLAESAQECHVHLEMTDEGIPVDPMAILK